VDRAMERDRAHATAEFLAQFRNDIESFVPFEVVSACVGGYVEAAPVRKFRYHAFNDPAVARRVKGDRYAGEFPRELYRKRGIEYRCVDKVKSDLYRDLLPLLNSGRITLPKSDRLVQQICGLERRVSRSGRDSIDHGPGSHDDLANAVAGAADLVGLHRVNPPAIFGVYGSYPTNETGPHRWDGLIEEGPFAGGYASSK